MCVVLLGDIHRVRVTFTGLIIFRGSSMVLSVSCICVNEYISFMYGFEVYGWCGVIGERGVSKCMGVGGYCPVL